MTTFTGHPLEPLTAAEVQQAVRILKATDKVKPTTRFVSVSLHEPPKDQVHGFTTKKPLARHAFAVMFDNAANLASEAVVSLAEGAEGKITSWKDVPGVQPTMTVDEQIECEQAVLRS